MFQAQALVTDSPTLTRLANSPLYPLIFIVQQFFHWLFMGYSLIGFCLFTYDKWLKVRKISECGALGSLAYASVSAMQENREGKFHQKMVSRP